MTRSLATIKFGGQTADSLAAILGADPTAERMERVGAAIMEYDSRAELLARCSGLASGQVCVDSSLQVRGG